MTLDITTGSQQDLLDPRWQVGGVESVTYAHKHQPNDTVQLQQQACSLLESNTAELPIAERRKPASCA